MDRLRCWLTLFVFTSATIALVLNLVFVYKQKSDWSMWPSFVFGVVCNTIIILIYLASLYRLRQIVKDFSHKTPSEIPIMLYCALLILTLIVVAVVTPLIDDG